MRRWRRLTVDWRKEFPAHKFDRKVDEPLRQVDDLMPLDVGPLYTKVD